MAHSNITAYFESREGCEELLRDSCLKDCAEVPGRESKLLFLKDFIKPELATKWLHWKLWKLKILVGRNKNHYVFLCARMWLELNSIIFHTGESNLSCAAYGISPPASGLPVFWVRRVWLIFEVLERLQWYAVKHWYKDCLQQAKQDAAPITGST